MTRPRCLKGGCGEFVSRVKPLKFKDNLVNQILDGSKVITWRINDDKDLSAGDKLLFVNADRGGDFALAEIANVREKKLGDVGEIDFEEGHERYSDKEDMIAHYREYYGNGVSWNSVLKMVKFKILEFITVSPPPPYAYGLGYIYLPLKQLLDEFPATVTAGGKELNKKDRFHVSLVCVKEIAPQIAKAGGISQTVAEYRLGIQFNEYVAEHPITLKRFQDEFRHVAENNNETIVMICSIDGLEDFFAELDVAWHISIPVQPAHTTLYCLRDKGIGITSQAAMERYPKVALPRLSSALAEVKYR